MSAPILRALLLVLQASHRAFANADKNAAAGGYVLRPEDYAALNVALVRLSSRLPSGARQASLTLRAEIALESLLASLEDPRAVGQVHPDSALPSRTEFDTTEAQYGALASMRAAVGYGGGGGGYRLTPPDSIPVGSHSGGCGSHCGTCSRLRSQCLCGAYNGG